VVASELHTVLMHEGELPEQPEACTYWGVTGTAAIGELRELWDAPVQAGSKRETLWKERFHPLAREAREVYIIDARLTKFAGSSGFRWG
jgi:hypothetical protein